MLLHEPILKYIRSKIDSIDREYQNQKKDQLISIKFKYKSETFGQVQMPPRSFIFCHLVRLSFTTIQILETSLTIHIKLGCHRLKFKGSDPKLKKIYILSHLQNLILKFLSSYLTSQFLPVYLKFFKRHMEIQDSTVSVLKVFFDSVFIANLFYYEYRLINNMIDQKLIVSIFLILQFLIWVQSI